MYEYSTGTVSVQLHEYRVTCVQSYMRTELHAYRVT